MYGLKNNKKNRQVITVEQFRKKFFKRHACYLAIAA